MLKPFRHNYEGAGISHLIPTLCAFQKFICMMATISDGGLVSTCIFFMESYLEVS